MERLNLVLLTQTLIFCLQYLLLQNLYKNIQINFENDIL